MAGRQRCSVNPAQRRCRSHRVGQARRAALGGCFRRCRTAHRCRRAWLSLPAAAAPIWRSHRPVPSSSARCRRTASSSVSLSHARSVFCSTGHVVAARLEADARPVSFQVDAPADRSSLEHAAVSADAGVRLGRPGSVIDERNRAAGGVAQLNLGCLHDVADLLGLEVGTGRREVVERVEHDEPLRPFLDESADLGQVVWRTQPSFRCQWIGKSSAACRARGCTP